MPANKYVSNDFDKLRAAQKAVDTLQDGPVKEILTFAVLQWMNAAFISHEPLSKKDMAWAKGVVKSYKESKTS